MSTRQSGQTTLVLLLLMAGLHFVVPDKTPLYFSAVAVAHGEAWRLVTGHLVHADPGHLFWNGLGLGVLGLLIERHSRPLLWISLAAGIASVNLLLLSPFSQLHYYCGLSGALNSLLVVALWLEWQASRSWLIPAVSVACALKVAVEIWLGAPILTDFSWPPYAWSHLAGLLGGSAVVLGHCRGCLKSHHVMSCGPAPRYHVGTVSTAAGTRRVRFARIARQNQHRSQISCPPA